MDNLFDNGIDKAAEILRESEERYRTLFSSMDEGFCVCEMILDDAGKPYDYRFLEVNPTFEKQTGLENAMGKTARQLVPNLEQRWFEIYGRVALTGEPVRFIDGSDVMNRWFDVYAFRVGAPEERKFAILFKDITARKRLERERERFLAVGSDLQVINGTEGYFKWVSPAWERTFGWTVEEMTTRPWTDFLHPDDYVKTIKEAENAYRGAETLSFENRYLCKDGSYRWLNWRAQTYAEENLIYAVATDITESKRAEENQKLLFEIAEKIRQAENADDLLFAVSEAVGEHLQVRRCLFNEIDLETDRETVHRDYCRGARSVVGVHPISEYSPVTSAEMAAGRTVINRDSQTDSRTAEFYEQTYAPTGERAYIAVPLMRDASWVASLRVSDDRPRNWSEQEIGLLEAIAERAWLAVEKLRNEAALRESEERFSKAFNTTPHLMTITRLEGGRYLSINDSVAETMGYSREEMIGHTTEELNIFAAEPEGRAKLIDAFQNGVVRDLEIKLRTKNGGIRLLKLSADIINVQGEKCILTSSIDITESRRAEDALREINQRFSATYAFAPVGIVESSPEGRYISSNEEFCAITGYDKKELSELGIREVTHAEDFPADIELHQKLVAGEIPFYQIEKRYVRKDGSIVWCDLFRSAVRDAEGKTLYTIGAVSDITTRKLAEEASRESEESYRILAETASDAIIRIDENSAIQFVNTAAERIFGYATEEMIGQSLTMLMPEEMRQKHRAGLARYMQTGKRNLNWESIEVPARHKTGHLFPLEISFGEYHSEEKRFFIGIARDITKRKQNEKATAHLAAIVESSDDIIISKDLDGIITSWNKGAEKIYGYTANEVIGKPMTILIPPNLVNEEPQILERIRRGEVIDHYETVRRRKNGTELNVSLTISPIRDEAGNIIGASKIARDITERRKAEELLRESEERFAKAFNSSPLTVTITSLNTGKLVEVNDTFTNLTGYKREEAIGRTTYELGLWQKPTDRDAELTAVKTKGQIRNREYCFRMKDGTEIVGLLSAELLELGGEPCALTVIQDITERKQAEEKLAELNRQIERQSKIFDITLSTITDCVYNFDRDGRFLYANQILLDLWNLKKEDAIGKTMAELDYPKDVESRLLESVRQVFDTRQTVKNETFYTSPTGVGGYFENILSPFFAADGTVEYVTGSSRDITERKSAERDRERLLEREQELRLQAEQANRLKDEFLANVSHELRTPLNAILGWSNMLQTGKANDDLKARANEVIYRNAKSQAQLIEDLLDVSRIITGKMRIEPRPIQFASVIKSAIDTVRPAADAKSIELETNLECEPCMINGDTQRLQQIVWNLLSNAVKFTPEGGKVEVKLDNRNSHARLTVSDTGKGIEAEFLPFMFERFRQEDASSTRRHGGLGLGLAIVRHLVELHGGAIAATSAGENLGSTFTVELPLAFTDVKQTGGEAKNMRETLSDGFGRNQISKQLTGIRVLLVDDEFDTLEMLDAALSQAGADVRVSSSAKDAFEVLQDWRPEVLVSDIAMPDEDGYSLIKKVRQLAPDAGGLIPAIAMTAYVRTEDKVRVLASGFQAYIPKPAEPTELITAISGLIKDEG